MVEITALCDWPFIPRSNSPLKYWLVCFKDSHIYILGLTRLSVQNNSTLVCRASCKQIFRSETARLYQKQKSIMNSEKSHSWNAENIISAQELPISVCPVGLLKHTLDMKINLLWRFGVLALVVRLGVTDNFLSLFRTFSYNSCKAIQQNRV